LLMHIETDLGEGLTDVAEVELPDEYRESLVEGEFPLQALSDAGMKVVQGFIPLYREALGK
jgi:hypothetical protein